MMGHTEKKKNYLKLIGAFVLGAVLTLAITGASGAVWQGKLMTDFDKEKVESAEADTSAWEEMFGSCSTTNCDLEDMIEDLHDEVGRSTWTLQTVASYTAIIGQYNRDLIGTYIDEIHDELGSSSWTLEELAKHQYDVAASVELGTYYQLEDLHDEVGYSSWTLESLAELLNKIYSEVK